MKSPKHCCLPNVLSFTYKSLKRCIKMRDFSSFGPLIACSVQSTPVQPIISIKFMVLYK